MRIDAMFLLIAVSEDADCFLHLQLQVHGVQVLCNIVDSCFADVLYFVHSV